MLSNACLEWNGPGADSGEFMLRNQANGASGATRPGRPLAARTMPAAGGKLAPVPVAQLARKPVFGAKAVGSFVPRLTRASFEKYGFSAATLITDWAQIVGADLARVTAPERLKWPKGPSARSEGVEEIDQGRPGATLIMRVDDGRALDIQYKARQIAERINAYFGYRAVAEIRILQAPIERNARALAPRPPARPTQAPPAEVTAIADPDLRGALERMAAGIESRRSSRK